MLKYCTSLVVGVACWGYFIIHGANGANFLKGLGPGDDFDAVTSGAKGTDNTAMKSRAKAPRKKRGKEPRTLAQGLTPDNEAPSQAQKTPPATPPKPSKAQKTPPATPPKPSGASDAPALPPQEDPSAQGPALPPRKEPPAQGPALPPRKEPPAQGPALPPRKDPPPASPGKGQKASPLDQIVSPNPSPPGVVMRRPPHQEKSERPVGMRKDASSSPGGPPALPPRPTPEPSQPSPEGPPALPPRPTPEPSQPSPEGPPALPPKPPSSWTPPARTAQQNDLLGDLKKKQQEKRGGGK